MDGVTKAFNRLASIPHEHMPYFEQTGHRALFVNIAANQPPDLKLEFYAWDVDPLTGKVKVAGKDFDLDRGYASLRLGIQLKFPPVADPIDKSEWQGAAPSLFKEWWAEFAEENSK
jgi:hypothetical protein